MCGPPRHLNPDEWDPDFYSSFDEAMRPARTLVAETIPNLFTTPRPRKNKPSTPLRGAFDSNSDSASCDSDSEWPDESYLSGLADTIRWSVPCHK